MGETSAVVASMLDRLVQASTEGSAMAAVRRAHEVFVERGGAFDDSDPCFEERTQAFLDWFVLGYRDESGLTAAERQLSARPPLSLEEHRVAVGMCRSMRALLRIESVAAGIVACSDVVGGAAFAARPLGDPAGLGAGDVADGHLIPVAGEVLLGRGLVFHPREAAPAITALVPAARGAGVSRDDLLFALLRMRMRFDRYHGIRADKIYRFPFRGFP